MVDVRAMGSVPHALGSPADVQVRDYLMRRMTALGLSPQIQHGAAFESSGPFISGGAVDNVIGILPGKDRSAPALAFMAHHDSVHGSPGAADDTAGVASALEMVRAIKTKGMPDRDVMVVVTDGEEAGLLGARVFFDSPLATRVGYVINLETRGGGGRATMFETAADNGADIALYRRTAAMPLSNALSVFVYKHLPNDTDFTVAKAHGKVGLNYAFIGRQFDYHSPSSTPEALDQGALQHMGAQILPTATALAFGPLPGRAPDAVYGNVLGSLTVQYPAWGGWLAVLAAAGLIVIGAWRAHIREGLTWPDVARGAGASLYGLAGAVAVLELVRRATGVGTGWMDYRPILARFPQYEVMMLAAALGLVVIAAALSSRKARALDRLRLGPGRRRRLQPVRGLRCGRPDRRDRGGRGWRRGVRRAGEASGNLDGPTGRGPGRRHGRTGHGAHGGLCHRLAVAGRGRGLGDQRGGRCAA